MAEVAAAFDCGSNSTRLFIYDAARGALERATTITRLSEGVDASATLRDGAIERTVTTLRAYRETCERAGVTTALLVATSAVRDAANAADFVARARVAAGCEVRVLSGEEEAAFSYDGATSDLELSEEATMIVDVGGGSTEVAGPVDGELASVSMQLGCVRVSERALGAGRLTADAKRAATAMIVAELDRAFELEPALGSLVDRARMVGLAGTVSTLVQLDVGLVVYDRDVVHHHHLALETVRAWRDRLGEEEPAVRLARPGMVRGREDVIVAGLYVLEAVMERFGCSSILSSESDILDGVVRSLLAPRLRGVVRPVTMGE